jgi:hypothetical protein
MTLTVSEIWVSTRASHGGLRTAASHDAQQRVSIEPYFQWHISGLRQFVKIAGHRGDFDLATSHALQELRV